MSDGKKSEISVSGGFGETDKALAAVIEAAAGDSAKGIVGFAGDVLGALIGDRMKEWRTRNVIASCQKTAEFLKRRGINPRNARALPNAELYALFDGSSTAEAPSVQELWASLLASRMDPRASSEWNPEVTELLKNFTSEDAHVFAHVVQSADGFDRWLAETIPQIKRLSLAESMGFFDWVKEQQSACFMDEQRMLDPTCLQGICDKLIRLGLFDNARAQGPSQINVTFVETMLRAHLSNLNLPFQNQSTELFWNIDGRQSAILEMLQSRRPLVRYYAFSVDAPRILFEFSRFGKLFADTVLPLDGR